MAVILPFEEEFYKKYHIPVTYVGHPLLESVQIPIEKSVATNEVKEHVIGLLPGSRDKEIQRLLPVMLAAAEKMFQDNNRLKFMLSIASSIDENVVYDMVRQYSKNITYEFISGSVHQIFEKCTFAIAVSGTVTLEAGIAGLPMVIIYKVSLFTYILGRLLTNIKYASLVNLIYNEEILPELIQHDATPENISMRAGQIIYQADHYKKIREKLFGLRKIMGGGGASKRVADIAFRLIQ